MRMIFTVAALFTATVFLNAADIIAELTTLDGKTYKQVKVMKVLPVEIRIMHADGFATVPLSTLPPEIRANYGAADANAEAMYAAQKKQENMAAASRARQEKEALQVAEFSHQPLVVVRQAIEVRDWCLANPQGGTMQGGVNLDAAARNAQLEQAMQTLKSRPVNAAPTPAVADSPPATAMPAAAGAAAVTGVAFTPGVIELISARYTLKNDQPRNVKNRLAKMIPKGTITSPVTLQVTDALSDAALDEVNVTTAVGAGVSATQNGVTVGVAEVVVQGPQRNMLMVEYMYNGQRLKKQALEGSYLVLP